MSDTPSINSHNSDPHDSPSSIPQELTDIVQKLESALDLPVYNTLKTPPKAVTTLNPSHNTSNMSTSEEESTKIQRHDLDDDTDGLILNINLSSLKVNAPRKSGILYEKKSRLPTGSKEEVDLIKLITKNKANPSRRLPSLSRISTPFSTTLL